ncbi:aldolase [Paenibacillus agaridevorans]|uniref:aldolase n=1 Tax=Paenibacillus agaridevorans TaxID=171404 RepID=UPI001BE43DA4|nr:aldolase [Paenibacillus agaridevorans]
MIEQWKGYTYKAFGLHIATEIPFLGAKPTEDRSHNTDVWVEWGDLTALWEEVSNPDDAFVVLDDKVLFRIGQTAVYSVEAGTRVIVSPEEGAHLERIRLFLDGYCMAILLLQRNILPLHGSAIAKNGLAYAIVGSSGAGKSTLTKALLDQGFSFVSDDIIPVALSDTDNELAIVWPALPEQKLWQESLSELGVSREGLRVVYERKTHSSELTEEIRTKYAVPVARFSHAPMPLAGIFELAKREDATELVPIEGAERLRTLALHTFHRSLIEPMGLLEWHFRTIAGLANRTDMMLLGRQRDQYSAPALVQLVLENLLIKRENAS